MTVASVQQNTLSASQNFNHLNASVHANAENGYSVLNPSFGLSNYSPTHTESEKQLRELLVLLPVGVVVIDHAGCVSDANPVAIDLLGIPLIGELWRDVIQRSFAPRADDGYEVSLLDGRRVQISTRALSDGNGQLVVLSDLTETRDLQTRLARHDRLASIGQIMASLSHQLRTPISTALLSAYQLQSHSKENQRYASRVIDRLQFMERQIADMLLIAGGGAPKVELISVDSLLQKLVDNYQSLMTKNGIQFNQNIDVSACHIIGNVDAILGAMGNLVDNSIHVLTEHDVHSLPEITLSCEITKSGRLSLSVSDNGGGMSPGVLARLKEPFFTTRAGGTGLGLAVVQAVAESHQATFEIESVQGKGSHFTLAFPMAKSEKNILAKVG